MQAGSAEKSVSANPYAEKFLKRVFFMDFKTLVIDGSAKRRSDMAELLGESGSTVVLCSSSVLAVKRMAREKFDLLLISDRTSNFLQILVAADNSDLNIELIFRPRSNREPHRYLCRTSFPAMKTACHILQNCGIWGEVRTMEQLTHERYRKIMNRVSEGILETSADGRVVWANNAFKGMLGRGDIENTRLFDLVDNSDISCLKSVFDQYRNGIITPFMVRLKDGPLVEVDASPRFSKEKKYLGAAAIVRHAGEDEEKFEASRSMSSLYSLALSLSRSFGTDQVIGITSRTLKEICGYSFAGIELYGHIESSGDILSLSDEMSQGVRAFCGRLSSTQAIRIIKDIARDPDPCAEVLRREGFAGLACVPLKSGNDKIGHIWALGSDPSSFTREKNSFLISVGVQAGMALQNCLNVQTRLTEEKSRRHFYRDALQAVTQGKLILCEYDELNDAWEQCGYELKSMTLHDFSDVPESRHFTEDCLKGCGLGEERVFDMVTCVSEAVTNAVKYGPPGTISIRADKQGVRVRIDDVGPGISFTNIPKAVLLSGFSTGVSLGLGYSVMLELCDHVHLATGEKGTSLIMEMLYKSKDPLDAFIGFADASI